MATKKTEKPVAKKADGVPLSTITKKLSVEPKNARQKLRRLEENKQIPQGVLVKGKDTAKWTFTAKAGVAWCEKALKEDGRKAA